MSELTALLQQREELEQRIQKIREQERAQAIEQVRAIVQKNDLSMTDVFGNSKVARQPGATKKVAIKYMNKATGETWTGRGKPPRWIQGLDREQFKV
ncbi:H-NS family nucleoid-associated regulatory protein [Vandammella animalimorsus]|uniref:Histone n=1 Tax=Vandammella animalimorsus TaxID=2029117 RepID=A0A2A2AGW1_9BURK|nr:H-NS histone family protein [Vandammella animalimorsus]PAT36978.1 histone [Vandammella animalimorsus]